MGQFDVRIPDYMAPDIGSPLQSIAAHEDELRKISNEQRNTDRKASADAARVKWEQDQKLAEQKQADDIARSNMLLPNSPLMQAAGAPNADPTRMSAIGSPYGISFESPAATGVSSPSSAADTGAAINKMFNPALSSPVVPPDVNPADEVQMGRVPQAAPQTPPSADSLGPLGKAAIPAPVDTSPNPDIAAEADALGAQPAAMRHMYAKVAGQRFEVQPSANTTGLGPEYDHLYASILPHVGEAKAMQLVIAKAEKDNAALATADAIESKRGNKVADDEKYRLTADEQKNLRSQPLDNAEREKLAAIRNGGGAGMPMPDPKAMQAWLAVHKEGKTSSLAVQAVRNRQIFDRLATEMDQGQVPNAVSQKMALHSLATLSTSMGGTGARVAVQIVNDINNANGLIDSVENKLYQARNHGQNMPQIMNVYRNAGARLRQLNDTISRQVYDSVDAQSGNKSAFAQVPQLAPIVSGAMRGFKMDLGLPDDEQLDGAGAPAAQAPPPAPHASHRAPNGAAPPPPTQSMPPQAAAALQFYIRSAQPGDPKAEQAKATLRAHGYPE